MFALLLDLLLRPFTKYFAIVRDIGSGTFGTVVIAKHKESETLYAAKFIKKKKIKDFIKTPSGEVPLEIFLLEKLSHPNIMPLYTFHKLPQHWVFTMDYSVDTVDLRLFTRTQGRLAEVTARYVLAQVYSAVTFCLQNGVDHRDVKDQNILINKNTHHVQLIDFGGASIVTRDTVYTTIQGTEVFLPPEAFSIHGYSPLEGSVWGLGCLLYCMVCGRPPFRSKREVVQLEVVYPTFLSASCMDFIKVCLMKERGRRMKYEKISSHCWATDL